MRARWADNLVKFSSKIWSADDGLGSGHSDYRPWINLEILPDLLSRESCSGNQKEPMASRATESSHRSCVPPLNWDKQDSRNWRLALPANEHVVRKEWVVIKTITNTSTKLFSYKTDNYMDCNSTWNRFDFRIFSASPIQDTSVERGLGKENLPSSSNTL